MKLLLLRVLLQRRARDEGFTLPMVIALGLVMILLGAVNITGANEENLNAINQNSRSDALAIAEVGIARYRELLDRNRVLALYSTDTTNNGWTGLSICEGNIANFYPGSSNSISLAENGLDLNNDGDTTDAFAPGSYELVSYTYSNGDGVFDSTSDANNADATGTLKVSGTTPDGNGSAQIEVQIPLRINASDMNNLAPALWITNNTPSLGDLTIGNGNLVIKNEAVTTSGSEADGCGDFSGLETADIPSFISDPRDIPSIQSVIATVNAASSVIGDQTNNTVGSVVGTTTENAYVTPPTGETFNANTHCANIRSCRYYYNLTTAQSFSSDVRTDGIAKATLYVNSTLEIDATSNNVSIGSGVSSDFFEIYVNGQNITIDTTGGYDVVIDAFIHAPGSTLEIKGDGGSVTINGSVWVNDFVGDSDVAVVISPDDSRTSSTVTDKAYEFYTTTTDITPKPLTSSPVNWKTEEVD